MADTSKDTSKDPSERTADDQEQDDPKKVLDGHAVEAALLEDWRVMFEELHGRFKTGNFATGVELVDAIGESAEEANHHPDVSLTYTHVEVHLTSHDVGGVTSRDIALAREISDHAGRLQAKAVTQELQVLELGLDTWDIEEIRPFWAAVLGLSADDGEDDEVIDGTGRLPSLWFQGADRHDEPQQRFHYDLRVPPEVAESRVRAAVEAGGTLVSDARAPSFWVLADAQGNKCCITTWIGRA